MSRVALSILRLSLWEIDHVDTVPAGASINEAVELAKKYGNDDDFSFVNGVLGAYVRRKDSTEQAESEEKDMADQGGAEAEKVLDAPAEA